MGSIERQRQSDEAAAAALREPFPSGTSIARYSIISLIGAGAMGDVYRAHDRALGRDVALKVLPSDVTGDRERVRRFAHEARSASALSHPHIVGIHEVGHARPVIGVQPIGERPPRRAEVHYIAMEYIEGETLRAALQNGMSLRRSIELLAQVADGLGKAHAAGIIHRDLKPDNILVSADGYAKIVDFGLAKLTDTSWNPIGADSPTLRALTAHGELLGTPGYMAPEQIVGKPLDQRSDIFSFGCILYEALTHARAFEAESFVDTLYKIIHEEPVPVSRLAPNTPPELERIVERCLAKDREARYQSIRDLAADLRQWHGDSGPRATPMLSAGPLNPRFSARMILLFALIAAVPILAFILLGKNKPAAAPAIDSSVRKLTSDGHAWSSAISPDGRYVAYITRDASGPAVWLEQIATGRTLSIAPATNAKYVGLTFSRDGEYVYFTRYDDGALGTLYRVPILGGAPEPLVKDVDSRAAIAPDNKQLAFVRDDFNKGTSTILIANTDGTGVRALTQFRMPDRAFAPAWSPDGANIVVAHATELVTIDVSTGKTRKVASDVDFEAVRGVAWRDATHLVTAATTDAAAGHSRLWSVDLKSGAAVPMTSDLTALYGPTISENGSIAALQVIKQSNVFEVKAEGGVQQLTTGVGSSTGLSGVTWLGDHLIYGSVVDGQMDLLSRKGQEVTQLTKDAAYEMRPTPSPDGTFVAYLSSGGGSNTIWRIAPDGSQRTQLTQGPKDESFAISPNSKTVAYASLDTKTNEWVLWVMPSVGGPRRRITSRRSVLEDIRFTRDGKTLFFTGYEKDMLRLYRVPVAGGIAEEMVINGRAHAAVISPDGSTIAAPSGSPDKLHASVTLVPVRGGDAKVYEFDGAMYEWHPRGNALSFVREETGSMNLWLRPLDGEPKKLTWFNDGSIMQYAWNGDGSRAAVTHVVDSVDVVLIK
jgi:eukaryotic-like serine/threonine-protein kinase